MQHIINPANKLLAPPIPKVKYIGLENRIAANANELRVKSDAANRLAVNLGSYSAR